jgi:hypothetical protein
MRKRMLGLALTGALGLSVLGAAPAFANEDDVIREGSCSASSDWKLKLSPENGMIEVEFEVDQNVNDQVWKVQLLRDGERFFRGRATTVAPSGSFEVRQVISNPAGTDTVRAIAKNPATGETCRGTVSADF